MTWRFSCSIAYGISLDQGLNLVSCIGRQILYHWATRDAHKWIKKNFSSLCLSVYLVCLFNNDHGLLQMWSLLNKKQYLCSLGGKKDFGYCEKEVIFGYPPNWTLSSLFLKKCKSKSKWVITSHQSEWSSWKCLQITNAGEDVQKREPSYTVN